MQLSAGLGIAAELASANKHALSPWEQFNKGGEVNACTAIIRVAPKLIRTFMRQRLGNDVLPFSADSGQWNPETYGNQSVVYTNDERPHQILKISRPGRDFMAEWQRAKEGIDLLGRYAARHTVSTLPLVVGQVSGAATPALALLQDRVVGQDFFAGGAEHALPSEIYSLHNSNLQLMEEQGKMIDLDGPGNILVTDSGFIKIVDVGLSAVESLEQNQQLQNALAILSGQVACNLAA